VAYNRAVMAPLRAWLARLGQRPTAALLALLIGTYAFFYQAGGWNQNSRFDLVRAMVEDGRLTIDRFEKNTGDDSIRDGHYYCDKAPGASWLCTPTYAVMYWLAGSPARPSPTWLAWAVWLSIVLAIGVPSAIAAVFLARLARALGIDGWGAYAVALTWALASLAFPYSTLLYGNQLSASLLVIAFTLVVEIRGGAAASGGRMFAVGLCLGLAGATEYPAMLVAVPIAIYGAVVLWVRRDGWPALARTLGWAVVGGVIPLGALAVYHTVAFGSPGTFPYKYSVWKEPSTGWFMGIGEPKWPAVKGTFWGEHRGLLYAMPWLVLVVPGALALGRRYLAEVIVSLVAIVAFLWLNVSIKPWHGGWATGPRYVVPMLPFTVLLCGGTLVWLRGRARAVWLPAAIVLGLGVVWSGAHMLGATAVKPEISEKIKRPYRSVVWRNWNQGELAISRQSIDMAGNPERGPKQAWNLGMKAGLTGRASLVPLALWWLACGVWLARALRRRSA
jgi:hypothetical protein